MAIKDPDFKVNSSDLHYAQHIASFFVNFVLFTRDRILTNDTQLNCFIPLSYSLI